MKEEKILYKDAKNYSPVDVIKGVDLITKKIVMADELAPAGYEKKPKCKFCKNFTSQTDKEHLGVCQASQNKFIAYPDMTSVTCSDYEERK